MAELKTFEMRCTVSYDPAKADPESLCTAFDRLMETAMGTPGILGEYGDPEIIEGGFTCTPEAQAEGVVKGGYVYRYIGDQGQPLTSCPYCDEPLTDEGGIDLTLSIDGHIVEHRTRLDGQGYLDDTADGAVAKGFHSVTECGHCGEQLVRYEEVSGGGS